MRASDPATGLAVRVDVAPDPPRAGAPVAWTLAVSNHGRAPCSLTFPSAQRGDVVLAAGGEERFRWSSGMVFAAMLTELRLAPGEERRFSLEAVLPVEPGEYSLVATVTARPAPPTARGEIVVTRADPLDPS